VLKKIAKYGNETHILDKSSKDRKIVVEVVLREV
jgi:hypothetical protein